ncbi:MAG: hypothetical protein ABF649_22805, partial [Bacillus sp. (in: firmicutes)]
PSMINKTSRKGVGIMSKKQLVDLVNKMKKSGIKISFTKPKSQYIVPIQQNNKLTSSTSH